MCSASSVQGVKWTHENQLEILDEGDSPTLICLLKIC